MSTSIKVINTNFEHVSDAVYGIDLANYKVNIVSIYKVVNSIMSNSKRVVYSHYKSISGLSGSGRKLRRQKRTGRARVGAVGSISTRGGAVKFGFSGNKAIDYVHKFKRFKHINRKEAAKVLTGIVANRYRANKLTIVDNFQSVNSTKNAYKFTSKFVGTNLMVYSDKSKVLYFGNLKNVELCHIDSFNALKAAKRENIIFDKSACDKFILNVSNKFIPKCNV